MKLGLLSVLSLSLLLLHAHFSLGGKSGKSSTSKKSSSSSHGKTQTSTKTDSRSNQGSASEGGYPKQPGSPGQGGEYGHDRGYGGHGGYGHGGYGGGGYGHGGYGAGHGYGGYGRRGYKPGDGAYGGSDVGGFGSDGGGYINQNRILSPHYGNSFGWGGRGGRGGSPFSRKVNSMGVSPSHKSKGFGRTAAKAATGAVVAKMAVDYGLGRFPRPQFQFQSPEEEYYYNHYMYTMYGVKSTDANDYSRDYAYSQPLDNFERHMNTCMKTIEKEKKQQKSNKTDLNPTSASSILVPNNDTDNNTAADNSSSSATPNHLNQTEAKPLSPTSAITHEAANATTALDHDDDTVSILETGYPALIKMTKVRECVKSYIVNSEKYLKVIGGAQKLEIGCQMALAVVTSALLMVMNSNMLQ